MKKFLSAFMILVVAGLLIVQELDLEFCTKSIAKMLNERIKKMGFERIVASSVKDKETGKYYFTVLVYERISKAKIMELLGTMAGDIGYLAPESLNDAKLAVCIPTSDYKFVTVYELSVAECKEGANIEDDDKFADFIKSHVKISKRPNK